MKIKYLNHRQATAICSDYQHLVGNCFTKDNEQDGAIHQVIVAPYSRILQWQFLRSLASGMSYEQALGVVPNGRYDVVVLPEVFSNNGMFRVKVLRDYLEEHEVPFNIAQYSSLKPTAV